jgi:hypothetical protein
VAQRDVRPSGVLEDESRANEAVNQHHSHDLQVSSGICYTAPLGTSSFTIQQPEHIPYATNLMGVASGTPTRVGEDTIQGVSGATKEALPATSPFQLHGRMDGRCPHPTPTPVHPAPVQNAGMASSTCSIIPTIPSESLSSSTTLLPSTEGSSNGSDHGVTRSSLQQATTQELSPCAEYVAPSKGPMSGGVEVTIVGTNFPHTLPLRVYFNTKLALVVSWKHLVRGWSIDARLPPDSKDSGDHTVFCSRRIIPWNCRRANSGGTLRIGTRD